MAAAENIRQATRGNIKITPDDRANIQYQTAQRPSHSTQYSSANNLVPRLAITRLPADTYTSIPLDPGYPQINHGTRRSYSQVVQTPNSPKAMSTPYIPFKMETTIQKNGVLPSM